MLSLSLSLFLRSSHPLPPFFLMLDRYERRREAERKGVLRIPEEQRKAILMDSGTSEESLEEEARTLNKINWGRLVRFPFYFPFIYILFYFIFSPPLASKILSHNYTSHIFPVLSQFRTPAFSALAIPLSFELVLLALFPFVLISCRVFRTRIFRARSRYYPALSLRIISRTRFGVFPVFALWISRAFRGFLNPLVFPALAYFSRSRVFLAFSPYLVYFA